jgi:thioesterase domain-containing protein/acyl carrier protein
VAGVADAAIAVRRNSEETILLAFITAADPGDGALADRARRAMSITLPTSMQPARLLVVDRFPLLPGGKVDEAALLAIGAATPQQQRNSSFVASPTARRAVARAWLRVLDRSSLDADVPFEEAGGDSLRLLRFVFHLEEQYRLTLPLDAFRAELRPSDYAQALDTCLGHAPIVRDSSPVVFLLPGTSKDGPRLARFRAACAPALHMVPLDYGDWPEWCTPNFDFTALLAHLIRAIEIQAPEGPILLAGYSIGGIIAHALATALSASGRSIGFLGILDIDITRPEAALMSRKRRFLRQKLSDLVDLVRRGKGTDALAWIIAYSLTRPGRRPMLRLAARLRHLPLPGALGFYLHRRLLMTVLLQVVAARRAEATSPARPLRVPAVLFRSEAHAIGAADDLGWRDYCPGIAVVPVCGDHHTMLDLDNLETLCRSFVAAALHPRDETGHGSDPAAVFDPEQTESPARVKILARR